MAIEEIEDVRAGEEATAKARPRRSPGRPPWKHPDEKMVSRQIYMSEAEWQVCKEQGNASAFLRRLVCDFAESREKDSVEVGPGGV